MGGRASEVGCRTLRRRHRIDPRRIKIHLSYTVEELARLLRCHKRSVRNWLKQGLTALNDGKRPLLIQGSVARIFLEARRQGAKRRCKPDELYCFSCRRPCLPAEDTVTVQTFDRAPAMVSASCSMCGTRMFRRISAEAAEERKQREAKAGLRTLKQAA